MIAIPLKSIMQCTFAPVRDTIHNTKTPCGCYSAMLHLCGVCAFMESMCMCDCEICISAWTTPQMSSWTTQRCCIFVECARSWNPCACATVKYALVLGLRRGPVGQMTWSSAHQWAFDSSGSVAAVRSTRELSIRLERDFTIWRTFVFCIIC